MGGESALVLVVSSDPELRREIADDIGSERAVVVTSASWELAGPMLAGLQAPVAEPEDPVEPEEPVEPVDLVQPVRPTDWPADLEIDRRRMQVVYAGVKVGLTRHEYDLLALMATDPDKIWKQDDLHLEVWHTRPIGDNGDLHSTVKRLRRKLNAANVPLKIQAMRGFGYGLLLSEPALEG